MSTTTMMMIKAAVMTMLIKKKQGEAEIARLTAGIVAGFPERSGLHLTRSLSAWRPHPPVLNPLPPCPGAAAF